MARVYLLSELDIQNTFNQHPWIASAGVAEISVALSQLTFESPVRLLRIGEEFLQLRRAFNPDSRQLSQVMVSRPGVCVTRGNAPHLVTQETPFP